MLSLALFASSPVLRAASPSAASANPARSTLNFPEAEIDALARVIAELLDRPQLVDPRVKGKMTLYTEQPVTPAQAYALFSAGLRGLGFAIVESNGLLKVVPEADAKLQTSSVSAEAIARRGDAIVTQVIRVVHENANNLVPVLRPLISPNNTINALLVRAPNPARLAAIRSLVAKLDLPGASGAGGSNIHVIYLQHVEAVLADRHGARAYCPTRPRPMHSRSIATTTSERASASCRWMCTRCCRRRTRRCCPSRLQARLNSASNAPAATNRLPNVRFRARIWRGDFNKRSTFAASAVYPPITTRSVTASVAAITRYCGASERDRSRNCGTTASRNTVPFGFTALIIQPRRINVRADTPA